MNEVELVMIRYRDLFNYLNAILTQWTCPHNYYWTKKFCAKHELDFPAVKQILQEYGGYCDCEAILNAPEDINEDLVLPR